MIHVQLELICCAIELELNYCFSWPFLSFPYSLFPATPIYCAPVLVLANGIVANYSTDLGLCFVKENENERVGCKPKRNGFLLLCNFSSFRLKSIRSFVCLFVFDRLTITLL